MKKFLYIFSLFFYLVGLQTLSAQEIDGSISITAKNRTIPLSNSPEIIGEFEYTGKKAQEASFIAVKDLFERPLGEIFIEPVIQIKAEGEDTKTVTGITKDNMLVFHDLEWLTTEETTYQIQILATPTENANDQDIHLGPPSILLLNPTNGKPQTIQYIGEKHTLGICKFVRQSSAKISYSVGEVYPGGIIPENTSSKRIWEIVFKASEGSPSLSKISLRDIFSGESKSNADWAILNQEGHIIKELQPNQTDGGLSFELPVQDRILLENGKDVKVYLAVSTRNISQENQSGKRVQWEVAHIEAAEGTGVVPTENITGKAKSDVFVFYKSELSLKHSSQQPNFMGTGNNQSIYFFSVIGSGEFGRATLEIETLGGLQKEGGDFVPSDFLVLALDNNYQAISNTEFPGVKLQGIASNTKAVISFDFEEQFFQEEKKEYVLILKPKLENPENKEASSISVSFKKDDTFISSSDRATQESRCVFIWSDLANNTHTNFTKDWHPGTFIQMDLHAQINVANRATNTVKFIPNKDGKIQIFPNPARETLNVNNATGMNYQVLHSSGKLALSGTVQSKISVRELKSGLYFLVIQTNQGSMSFPFVKK